MFAKCPVWAMPSTDEAPGHNCCQRTEDNRSNMVSRTLVCEGHCPPSVRIAFSLLSTFASTLLIPIVLSYKTTLGSLLKGSSVQFIPLSAAGCNPSFSKPPASTVTPLQVLDRKEINSLKHV